MWLLVDPSQILMPSQAVRAAGARAGEGRLTAQNARSAVFLDRDGVLIHNRDQYVRSWDDVEFISGAAAATRRLANAGYAIVVVTNQAAVARGLLGLEDALTLNTRILDAVVNDGGAVDAAYLCPHGYEDECICRKPAPGLLLQAATELSIDLDSSWMVGDAVSDVEAGMRAGVRPILVLTGRGQSQQSELPEELRDRVTVVADMTAAAASIASSGRHWPGRPR